MALNPRRKRYIQSPISAYFPSIPRAHSDSAACLNTVQTPLIPVLPDHIQSSLLNVGMRVRKAVPDGYRTISLYKPYHSAEYERPSKVWIMVRARSLSPTHQTLQLARSTTELVPFCGIHEVGGYGVQDSVQSSGLDFYTGTFDFINATFHDAAIPVTYFNFTDEDDIPFFSSQSSTTSTLSTDSAPAAPPVALPLRGRKRAIVDEDNEEEQQHGYGEAAGLILNCQNTAPGNTASTRKIATGRRRLPRDITARRKPLLQRIITSDLDFKEADFLSMTVESGEDMDLDAA